MHRARSDRGPGGGARHRVVSLLVPVLLGVAGDVSGAQAGGAATAGAPLPIRALTVEHQILYPTRLAVGPNDEVVVSDPRVGSVFFLDAALRPRSELQGLNAPLGIAFDAGGKIYVGNKGTGNVEVYNRSGVLLYFLGAPRNEFGMPTDIAVAPDFTVFVVDSPRDCVKVYDRRGRRVRVIGKSGSGPGQFRFPSTVALSPDGRELYVGDQGNHRVQVFTLDGRPRRAFGGPITWGRYRGKFACIQSLAVLSTPRDGVRVHVVDSAMNWVQVLSPAGHYITKYGRTGRAPGKFNLILDLAVDSKHRVLACNAGNGRVEVVQ